MTECIIGLYCIRPGISANSQEALSMYARCEIIGLYCITGISANSQEALSMYASCNVKLLDYIV